MPFFKSLPENAGPPSVYTKYPEIYGPWSQMSQAMMNVIQNALEATASGGQVTIKTFEESNAICISITDSGKGIPEPVKRKIFDPFFTTKEVGAGLGLGLPVVKSIMERHRGSILLESESGKGTSVKLFIPKG